MTNHRLPWSERPRWEHLVAASLAIALNAAGLWLVSRQLGPSLPVSADEDHFTQLVFIQKDPKPTAMRLTARADLQPPGSTTKPVQPRPAQPSKPAGTVSQPIADSILGDPVSTFGSPLNLSVPAEAISFKRTPVARPEIPIVVAPNRMALTFKDRSFGGMMQRMTHASICSELRNALNPLPANAASIIASMESYGCKV